MGGPQAKVNYRSAFGPALLAASDVLISLCIVAPLVVGYWRGTWFLLDTFLFADNWLLSCWLSLAIGFGLLLLATWFQEHLQTVVTRQNCFVYFTLSRLYTVLLCLGCVNHWRGIWATLDYYTGTGWTSSTVSLVVGSFGLIFLRAFRNILAPPIVLVVDAPELYFTFPTMFRTTKSNAWHLKIMDGLFSVVVVGSLVVLVWRGSFAYLEMLMFPGNLHWSAWGCTILGYSTSLLAFALQIPMASFCSRTGGFWRIAVYDAYVAVAYVGAVNVWRGLWNLYDIYLLPEHKTWSCLLTHAAGLIIASLCYCAHSILVRGVYLDAEEPGAAAAVLPCPYLRYFAKTRRQDHVTSDKNGGTERKPTRDRPAENGWFLDETETMMKEHTEKESTI